MNLAYYCLSRCVYAVTDGASRLGPALHIVCRKGPTPLVAVGAASCAAPVLHDAEFTWEFMQVGTELGRRLIFSLLLWEYHT